ncbi:MAG: matrixin family metalloprotease [Candidatus Gastranaerophilales bacterium]|nr:matrixin family metalloprotease [Candidatus Gastranaerophilales bacterium]
MSNEQQHKKPFHSFIIRLIFYPFVAFLALYIIAHEDINNHFYIQQAEKYYAQGAYVKAYFEYNKAFNTSKDNSQYLKNYLDTISKFKKTSEMQYELLKIKERYPRPDTVDFIDNMLAKTGNEIKYKYEPNYLSNAVMGSNIIHWNADHPITVSFKNTTKAEIPEYYSNEMKNAFQNWSNNTGEGLKFEYIDDFQRANIKISFVDSISGANCYKGHNCSVVLALTEPQITGMKLTEVKISFRTKDVDGSDFTNNQIFNISMHEIGHALGISGHSFNPSDVMFPLNNDASLSSNGSAIMISKKDLTPYDINTIRLLYKILPDISNKDYNLKHNPDMYYSQVVLGDISNITEQKLQESKNYVEKVAPNFISYMGLAEGYHANRDNKKAIEVFFDALRFAKTNEERFSVYFNLAVVNYEMGNYKEALDLANIASTYSSERAVDEVKAYCYMEMHNYDSAEMYLKQLVESNPANPIFSATLVNIYFKNHQYLKGISELKRIKQTDKKAVEDEHFDKYRLLLSIL